MTYQQNYQSPPKKHSSTTWWIIGGCGAILVLAALCACGFFVLGGAALLAIGTPTPVISYVTQTPSPTQLPSQNTPISPPEQPSPPPTDTPVPLPTDTPMPTPTDTLVPPTDTPMPTATPRPPTPTPTPSYIERNETQQIGPILDTTYDEEFTMEITLVGIKWWTGDKYEKPKSGHIYVLTHLRVKNLGPGTNRNVGRSEFRVLDANGALHDDEYVVALAKDCQLEFVDLTPGGSIEGCVSFEVPSSGKVDLIYAPYRYEGLKPGRYLSFNLRP